MWLWPITSALKGTAAPVTAPAQFAYLWFTGKLAEYGNIFVFTYYYSKLFSSCTRNKVSKISQALFPYHAFVFFSFNNNLYSSKCGQMRSDRILFLLYNKLNELLYFQKQNALTTLSRHHRCRNAVYINFLKKII